MEIDKTVLSVKKIAMNGGKMSLLEKKDHEFIHLKLAHPFDTIKKLCVIDMTLYIQVGWKS